MFASGGDRRVSAAVGRAGRGAPGAGSAVACVGPSCCSSSGPRSPTRAPFSPMPCSLPCS